ncbi:MAG TPA: hypothetical protein VMT34_09395 [Aggregatilineales bacterium]|nr:hypothetical protein [Aggregatilineales bacterium]
MTTELKWVVPDRIVEISFIGDLLVEDMLVLQQLDLSNRQKPVYLLLNEYKMRLAIPENALKSLDKTQGNHPMIGYAAVFGAPAVMELFGKLMTKMIGIKQKVGFFTTREQALAKVNELMARESN